MTGAGIPSKLELPMVRGVSPSVKGVSGVSPKLARDSTCRSVNTRICNVSIILMLKMIAKMAQLHPTIYNMFLSSKFDWI